MDVSKFRRTVSFVASAALITALTVGAYAAPVAAKPDEQKAEARTEAKATRKAAKQARAEARAEAKATRKAAKQARAEARAEAKATRKAAKQARAERGQRRRQQQEEFREGDRLPQARHTGRGDTGGSPCPPSRHTSITGTSKKRADRRRQRR